MGRIYGRYIAVNASWLAGSAGTLVLDGCIFAQFFLYRERDEQENGAVENGSGGVNGTGVAVQNGHTRRDSDARPLLERGDSNYSR